MPPGPPPGNSNFPNTRWSLVVQVADPDEHQSHAALEELCGIYWYPLYAYARRDGKSQEDAADLTQGFFEKLLSDENLKEARQERGKLRSYLLSALRNFIISQKRKETRLKRGGGAVIQSLDLANAEQLYRQDLASDHTPETLFERHWAITLLNRAMKRLREDYLASEKTALFEELQIYLGGSGDGADNYAETGSRLEMSEGAVKVAVHRMRKRYRLLLREEVADTVAKEDEIEGEIAYLFSVFA